MSVNTEFFCDLDEDDYGEEFIPQDGEDETEVQPERMQKQQSIIGISFYMFFQIQVHIGIYNIRHSHTLNLHKSCLNFAANFGTISTL